VDSPEPDLLLTGLDPAAGPGLFTGDRDYFITPLLEFERSFGNFDLYLGGGYSLHLVKLFPQSLFTEEKIATHLPLGSLAELQFRLQNETEIRIDPEGDNGGSGGRVKPELGGGLFLAPGDFSLALGLPLSYGSRAGKNILFGIDLTAAYTSPFQIGIEATLNFITASAAAVDGVECTLNYTQDQFYGGLTFKAAKSFDYFSIKAEFDYFFDFFIINAALKLGNLSVRDAITLAPAIGIKYRF
jgi:hypothetical protein